MCSELKVTPDRFRDIVGLRSNVETHLEKLPRSRRRAIWSGIACLFKNGIFQAKAKLTPHIQLSVDDGVHQFGAIHRGSCVTIVGIVGRKLTIYSVIDKIRLLRRAGQTDFCAVLDEEIGEKNFGRIRVIIAEYQFIVWAAFLGLKTRVSQYLMELLPETIVPLWQQSKGLNRT